MNKQRRHGNIRSLTSLRLALCGALLMAVSGAGPNLAGAQSRIPDADYQYLFVSGNADSTAVCRATIVFFEVPASVTSPLYFAIKSPGTSGTGTRNQYNMDDQWGSATDNTTWYLMGGPGTISATNAKRMSYTDAEISAGTELTGTQLWTKVYAQASAFAQSWDYTSAIMPSQGEQIGNKRYFKIIAVKPNASTRDNYFQLDVSTTPSGAPTGLSSVRAFAYAWAILPPTSGSLSVYPYAEDGDSASYIALSNFEGSSGWTITGSDKNGAAVSPNPLGSGVETMRTRSYALGAGTINGTWTFNFHNSAADNSGNIFAWKAPGLIEDDPDFNAVTYEPDGFVNSNLYRIYAAPYTPAEPDHVTIDPTPVTVATVAAGGSQALVIQVVDSAGNPVPYKRNVYVTATGSALINGLASPQTVTTDGSGAATITLTDTVAQLVTVNLLTNGTQGDYLVGNASNGDADLTFTGSPDPVIMSAQNTSFSQGGSSPLPSIVVKANGNGSSITAAGNIWITIPDGLNAHFDDSILAPGLSVSGSGVVNGTVSYSTRNKANDTLEIDVTTGFGSTDTLTITGLALTNSNGVSSGRLLLSNDLGVSWISTDDKTISITAATTLYTWVGPTSDWGLASNWSPAAVPDSPSVDVYIPHLAAGNYPSLVTGASSRTVRNLSMDGGTTLTLGTYNLTAAGSISLGSATVSGTTGAIILTGSGGTITTHGTAIPNLSIAAGASYAQVDALSVASAFSLPSGASLASSSANVSIGGNADFSGTYTSGANTLTLSAASAVNFYPGTNSFSTVTMSGSSTTTLQANGLQATVLNVQGTKTLAQNGRAITVGTLNLGNGSGASISNNAAITVSGATAIAVGTGNSVSLMNPSNDFQGDVSVTSVNNLAITDANAIQFGASAVSGTLGVTAGGDITQSDAITATGGTASFDAGTADITLTAATNNFSTVEIADAAAAQVTDMNSLVLGAATTTGDYTATALSGQVTGASAIGCGGTLRVNATAGITLSGTSASRTVRLENSASGNISYTNSAVGPANTLTVRGQNSASGGSFTVTETTGHLTVGAASVLTNAGAIWLTSQRLDGLLTITGDVRSNQATATGAAITLTADDMAIGGAVNAGTLGAVALRSNDLTQVIDLGNDTAGRLGLTSGELGLVTAGGGVTIGRTTHTGQILVSADCSPAAAANWTLSNQGGGIAVNAGFAATGTLTLSANGGGSTGEVNGAGTIAATSLTVNALSGIGLSGASTVQTVSLANTQSGDISYTGSAVGGANTLTVSGHNDFPSGLFTVTETSGNLTVGAAQVLSNAGDITLRTQRSGGTLTLTGNVRADQPTAAGADIILAADSLAITGSVYAGSSGTVALTSNDATRVIDIGAAAVGTHLDLSTALLNRISSAGGGATIGDIAHTGQILISAPYSPAIANWTILNRQGGIEIGANFTTTGTLTLTANANSAATGAITRPSAGTLTSGAASLLTLNAASGIGDIALGQPVYVGNSAYLSATNNRDAGDLYVHGTGALTLGAGYCAFSQYDGRALRVDASGNISIRGDVQVTSGSIELNANGTITEYLAGTWTLTASTVRLGTATPPVTTPVTTAIGTSTADRVRTAATTLLSTKSTTGATYLMNTGAVNLTAVSTSGLVNIANSGATTVTTGGITAGTSVYLSSSGALTVDNAVASTVASAITMAIDLLADSMAVNASVANTGNGFVVAEPYTNGTAINLGTNGAGLAFDATEIAYFSTGGFVRFGNTSSGAMTISGPVGSSSQSYHLYSASGIASSTIADVMSASGLALTGGTGAIDVYASAALLSAATAGSVTVSNARAAGLTLNSVTGVDGVSGVVSSSNAVSITETLGSLTVENAGIANDVNAGTGQLSLIASASGATLTIAAGATVFSDNAAGLLLRADRMSLSGSVAGNANPVTLVPATTTSGQTISLGGADAAGILGLTGAELGTVTTTGSLAIGSTSCQGQISVAAGGCSIANSYSGVTIVNREGGISVGNALNSASPLTLTANGDGSATTGSVSGSGRITVTGALTVNAASQIYLDNATNSAATVTLANSDSGDITFYDAVSASFPSVVNSATDGKVTLVNGGTYTTSLGTITSSGAGYVSISSGGAATQSGALVITAPGGLELLGAGSFSLGNSNAVPRVAANLTGPGGFLRLLTSSNLTVALVNGSDRIVTNGGYVYLDPTGTLYLNVTSPTVAVNTAGAAVDFLGPVILQTNTIVTCGTAAARCYFQSTVDSSAGDTYSLVVNNDASIVGSIGSTDNLSSLQVTGATTLGAGCAAVTTTGAQTYGGNVTLGAGVNFTGGSGSLVRFGGTLGGASAFSVTVTDADAEFDNLVGGAGHLVAGLDVTAGATTTGAGCTAINTSGTQNYGGSFTLGVGATLTATGTGVTFHGNVDGSASNFDLSVAGNAQIGDALADQLTNVRILDVSGTTALYAGTVTTVRGQYFHGATTLYNDVTFTGGSGYSVRFGNILNSNAGSYFSVETPTASASAWFEGVVGGTRELNHLIAGSAATVNANVHTNAYQTYSDTLAVTGSATLYSNGVANPANLVSVVGATTISSGATLTLGNGGATGTFTTGSIAGAAASGNLTINTSGVVTIGGVVGANIGTVTVTNSGGTTFQNSVAAATLTLTATTAGQAIEFDRALTVTGSMTSIAAAAFDLRFNYSASTDYASSVAGAAPTLDTSGSIVFGRRVGDSILFSGGFSATNASGERHLIGAIRSSGGAISLGDSTLEGDATIDATNLLASTGGATVTLGSVGYSAGTPTLVVRSGTTGGSFSQTAATTLSPYRLRIIAYGDIGTGLTATPIYTGVSYVEAYSFTGRIFLSNASHDLTVGFSGGDFDITGLTTTGANAIGIASTTANSVSFQESCAAGATGAFTATASDLNINAGATLTGNGGVALYPNADGLGINLNDATGSFSLSTAELQRVASTGNLTVGLTAGTGSANTINVGSAGAVALGSTAYNLALLSNGQNLTFAGASNPILALSNDRTLRINLGAGAIAGSVSNVADISLPYGSTGGILYIQSAGNVGTGTGAIALQTAVDQLTIASSGAVYINESNALILGSANGNVHSTGGLIDIANAAGTIGTSETVTTSNGSITIAATGALTVSDAITTTASGAGITLSGSSVALDEAVGAANNSDISITASAGAITHSGATRVGAAGSTSLLILSASTYIGVDAMTANVYDAGSDNGWLFTDVSTIRGSAASGIFIYEASGVQLGDAFAGLSATAGNLVVTAVGAITTYTDYPVRAIGATSDLYLNGSALTIGCAANAGRIVNLTGTSGITLNQTTTAVTGGTGLMTFNNAVSHTAGSVTVGAGGAVFAANYVQSGVGTPSLNGYGSGNPNIEFDADLSFLSGAGRFTHNGDPVVLAGTLAQAITPRGATFATLSVTKTGGTASTPGSANGDFTADSYSQSVAGGTFTLSAGATMTVNTSLSVTNGTLNLTGAYSGSGATFDVGTNPGTVTVGTAAFESGTMSISAGGSLTQTGDSGANTQSVSSLSVSGAGTVCAWDSNDDVGGSLTFAGTVAVTTGGSLSFHTKTVTGITSLSMSGALSALSLGSSPSVAPNSQKNAQTVNITNGNLAMGSATLNLSSAPNVIRGLASITDASSTISLGTTGGDLSLDSNYSIGNLNVNVDTTLIAGGRVKNLTIAAGTTLDLSGASNSVNLSILAGDTLDASAAGALLRVSVVTIPNTVALSSQTSGTPFIYTGNDIGYNNLALRIRDMNASGLATTINNANVTLNGTAGQSVAFLSVSVTGGATLNLDTGSLSCGAFTAASGTTVANPGTNTVTASGTVTIAGSFTTQNNSTLVMTGGAGTQLDATPQIGNLHIGTGVTGAFVGPTATVELARNLSLSGSLEINDEGRLDVMAVPYSITVGGDWTNRSEAIGASAKFVARTGTVTFTNGAGINVYGNTAWYHFACITAGTTIYFQVDRTQTILAPGSFEVKGLSGSYITISRQASSNQTAALGWILGAAPDASIMWQLDLLPGLPSGATLDLSYVTVKYSDARSHAVAVPDNVTVYYSPAAVPPTETALTCYQWITGLPLVYAYTEDSDGNGKIDRIRAVSAAVLNGDFFGFTATVSGYTVRTSSGTNGYDMVPGDDTLGTLYGPNYGGFGLEFFIYLAEKSYNDTGAKPLLSVTANSSLKDDSTKKFRLNTLNGVAMTCIDSAPPKIAHTLALPNGSQVFYHFSEPVYADAAGSVVSSAAFAGATTMARVMASGNGTSEALATFGTPVSAAQILGESTAYSPLAAALYDAPQTITNFRTDASWLTFFNNTYSVTPPAPFNENTPPVGAWPSPTASLTHRVSDVLVDVPLARNDDATFFMWPIYAKDSVKTDLSDEAIASLTARQSAEQGVGLIRAFDGSQWLRDQDITLQARLQPALAGITGAKLHFDSNVDASLVSEHGLWLPGFSEVGFSGIVPFPNASPWGRGATAVDGVSVANGLWNFKIPAKNPRIVSVSTVGFFFTLIPGPGGQPLYAARLDMAAGAAIPSDWYYRVRPFEFDIHDITLQRGGVTVLNNVIDPTKGETARLSYQQKKSGAVTVTVFTLDGDVVARLVNESNQNKGDHAVSWDGKNLRGSPVARGLYFIRLVAPGMDEIRKVIVVRK
jgi:hypothetical protein